MLHNLQGSGGDEIVGCAWDGMTYIVDQKRNVVKFNFGENVCAFCAGGQLYTPRAQCVCKCETPLSL